MAEEPGRWWDLVDFLNLRDLEPDQERGEHREFVDEGLSIVSIDDLLESPDR
ncbi:hypothetical protein ACFL6C_00835 [Myxococcota bacterium]